MSSLPNHRRPSRQSADGPGGIGIEDPAEPVDGAVPAKTGDEETTRVRVAALFTVALVVVAIVAIALIADNDGIDVDRSTWAYEMVQLEQANRMGLDGKGVRVGVIDTGIDTDHPSLQGAKVVAWRDLLDGRTDPYDASGHGTAVAGLIAGQDPLPGGAPGVELIVARVVDGSAGQELDLDRLIADGIDFCLDPDGDGDYADGADIISLSLGGRFEGINLLIGTRTEDAIVQAVSSGVLIVAAAGNDADDEDVLLPGRFQDVICVGAVDRMGLLAPFSTHGNESIPRPDPHRKPEVVAPGVEISTALPDERYGTSSGTSQATALTTAALAAVVSGLPHLRRDGAQGGTAAAVREVKDALMRTARPLAPQQTPHDPGAGYGLVQAVDLYIELES